LRAAFPALASPYFACRRRRFVIARGTLSPKHAVPWSAASIVQRGVVHGSVVVVAVVAVIVVVAVMVVVVVVGSSTGTTTLVSDAKFSSPGVPVLTARTVSTSDVPRGASAGG
jgi:hypothetical protein